jgi:hypothetical protein
VPAAVLARRDKMGFETPTDAWLRGRFAAEARRRLLGHGPLEAWLDMDALRAELEGFLGGQRPIGLQVWRWLSLDTWARRFISADPRVTEKAPEAILHAGRHRGYEEVTAELARDAAAGVAAG